ncbi:MGDG synthase family glycosyltransferase [Bacillus pinisoli]|uniref:MGDG synthase family glycosyltransferase n=1 Tax=Bacillus pinisoli TaxID=2901866 RepID=UPI001FF334F4|nr:hypothetical protein [Bacillus pinisoli]
MPKVLFFPLLRIPSGHHQVISTISEQFNSSETPIQYEIVELLSSTNHQMESMISTIYLNWIKLFPNLYHYIYKTSVYRSLHKKKRYIHYEWLFLSTMQKLIDDHQPDYIICSHALPSYLASKLREKGKCTASIINIYTDFFIHHIWGTKEVSAHFISLPTMREFLLNKGVAEETIFQTGIPIHPEFSKTYVKEERDTGYKVLVSGGSLGVGKIERLLSNLPSKGDIHYYVLCGRNEKLYTKLINKNHPRVTPFPYIHSKEKMNIIYQSVDAVLTKPGGVTISECLSKRLPIFVYDHLPGQEKINVEVLVKEGLLYSLPLTASTVSYEEKLLHLLSSEAFLHAHHKRLNEYHQELEHISVLSYLTRSM